MLNTDRATRQTVESRVRFSFGIVIGVLLLVLCASKPKAQQERTELTPMILVPMGWTPSLEQVQEDVEENLAAQPHQSQQALNKASQNVADLADARLFITYVLLLQKLDEKGRASLLKEQQVWLTQREASARAAVVSKGGSLAPLEYASAFGDITKKRLAELEARLTQQPTQAGGTPGRGEK
jgi:uncharacterized protein YecT (DUF1311 family)